MTATGFLLFAAVTAGVGQADSLPQALRDLERQLDGYERAELREDTTRLFIGPDREWLAKARGLVDARLRQSRDDVAALLLLGRIGRFALVRSRSAVCTAATGCVVDSTFDDAPYHAAIDRVLQLRPDAAAAHYWKARLVADGRPVIRNDEFAVDVDTAAMFMQAEWAVALDPRNLRYREFLAVSLADVGRYGEASDVIRPLERNKHPLHLILQDFEALRVPPGAVPWPQRALFFAVGLDESPPRFAAQTGRSWAVTLSRQEVEAFYQRVWPEFRLFEFGWPDSAPKVWMQHFRPARGGRLQPARDDGDIARPQKMERFEGLVMLVRRVRPADEEPDARVPPAVAALAEFTEIIVINGRKGPRSGGAP